MTTVRLPDDIDRKLSVLIDVEHTSKSEIIKKAILAYYETHIPRATPYELGKELFGQYAADSDLSETYKQRLMDKLNAKHSD